MCLAVPGKLISITDSEEFRSGRVSFGGIVKDVSLAYVPEATEGDYVLVHVGFAISVVEEAEAAQTLEYLKTMGELAELAEPASDTPLSESVKSEATEEESAVNPTKGRA